MPSLRDTSFLGSDGGITRFYDRNGTRQIHALQDPLGADRRWLTLDDLPPYLVDATMLAEDHNDLADHAPFDLVSTSLQLWRYILGMPQVSEVSLAGSLVREAVLPLTRSSGLDQSLLEIVLIAESKRRFSATELLEWRLNSQYYGRNAFGIDAAAQVYLGKSAESLTLAEATMLAAVAAEPAVNPINDAVGARERGADLLFKLLDAQRIDKGQFDAAAAESISIAGSEAPRSKLAPAFSDYARTQAGTILDRLGMDGARLLAGDGLRITTTLDLDLQLQADCLLRTQLARIAGDDTAVSALDGSRCAAAEELQPTDRLRSGPDTGALTLIDVGSGQILSMVGEAAASSRQPAIVLQPFVYIDAFLQRQFTPASMVYDLPLSYPGPTDELIYTPANPDGRYRGPLLLRDAMAAGLLPPAVQVANEIGMESIIQTAQTLGFNDFNASRLDLDVLERGLAVSVLDTAYAYSVLASMGLMHGVAVAPDTEAYRGRDPVAILRIEDADGRVLWSYGQAEADANQSVVIEPSLAYMVNDILADDEAREATLLQPALTLRLARPAAVIAGMSGDKRDDWTVGYTPDLVLAVHTTRADQTPLSLVAYGREGAAPVWQALMKYAHDLRVLPAREWAAPGDIEEFLVCEFSGLLPPTTDHCPTRREIVPSFSNLRRDDRWQTVEVNTATGQLATVTTPDELRERRAYFVPPEEIMAWWVENLKPLPPSSYSTESERQGAKPAQLTSPADFAYVGSSVDIAGRINRAGAVSWLLEYGAEVNPDRWFPIAEGPALDVPGELTATWETALLSGIYTLRFTVAFADGSNETDTKLLTFDNTPPAVKLSTSDGETTIRPTETQVVSLMADVSDNLTIARVAFYLEDDLLGEDRDWPYGIEAEIAGSGAFVFRAVAYDQVGNRAESALLLTVQG